MRGPSNNSHSSHEGWCELSLLPLAWTDHFNQQLHSLQCQEKCWESFLYNSAYISVSMLLTFLCSCRVPVMMAAVVIIVGGAQFFSRVAHGKVCTGAGTLSVWVKATYTFGLGTAHCWVTSLRDIWLTETNACGVSVKNDPPLCFDSISFQAVSQSGTKGNVLST